MLCEINFINLCSFFLNRFRDCMSKHLQNRPKQFLNISCDIFMVFTSMIGIAYIDTFVVTDTRTENFWNK